jgi:hypothetical protein
MYCSFGTSKVALVNAKASSFNTAKLLSIIFYLM